MRPNRLLKRLFATGTLPADGHAFWFTPRRFPAFHE
jgi:hypothetical protein